MEKNKKDYLIVSLGFQFLICVILFGVCFGLKSTNSDLIVVLKNQYFDKLDDDLVIDKLENINKSKNESDKKSASTETVASLVDSSETETLKNSEPTTQEKLSAEIKAEGGADVSVGSIDEIPENVSVNGYSLNQRMFLPVEGDTSSEFGVRIHPIDGDLRFHAGIDIAAPSGTPIYAAFDGTVIKAEYDRWNGYHIKIQHDNDIMTVYCHCEKLNVKKGDVVRAGEVIGTVGSTGSSTGPHLHFELRINNISYNPQSALDEAISAV